MAAPLVSTTAFGGAESSADAQKRALLAAVAQQGTVGRAAYDAQVKAADAARQAAVKAASDRGKLINAPTALTDQQAAESGAITDRYKADASAAQDAYGRETARSTEANGAYMDQVKAAIPLVQAVARVRADAAAAKTGTYAGQGNALADLIHGLGGETAARAQLTPALTGVVEHANATRGLAGNRSSTGQRTPFNTDAGASSTEAIDIAGRKLGLEPGTLQQFLGKRSPDYVAPVKQTRTLSPGKIRELRSNKVFQANAKNIAAEIKKLRTPIRDDKGKITTYALDMGTIKAQLRAAIISDPKYASNPVLYDLLIKEYL